MCWINYVPVFKLSKRTEEQKKNLKGSDDNVKNMSPCWINSNIFLKKVDPYEQH